MSTVTIYSSPIKSHELLWFDKIQVLLYAIPQCSAKNVIPKVSQNSEGNGCARASS